MMWLRFTLREPDRGRRRFTSREWWASLTIPRFWRTCTCGFRTRGHGFFEGDAHRGDCPAKGKYLGHVAKGWWHLWTLRDSLWRWESEIVFAIGGEDNMAQISVQLPILGRVAVGIKVPRSWTSRWVYQRREFGIELRGLWPSLLVGYDDSMADMHDYYVREYLGQGKPLPEYVTGLRLWPGWRLRVPTWRIGRLKNRLLGAYEPTEVTLKIVPATVTLPEGDYTGTVRFYRSTMKRPRWPRARRDDVYGTFRTDGEVWMPWPGKGENSYDCGDDGTQGITVTIGPGWMREHAINGEDVAKVVAANVAHVLKYRARYGSHAWKPEAVGVLRD